MNKITSEGDINTSQNRKKWQEKNIDFETNNVLRDDEEIFLHQSLSTPCLNVLKKSKGIYLEDISGKIYMDFHGNNVHQVGFGNEDVKKAIINEMETLPFSPRRYTNNSAITLAQKLADKTNGVLNKVLFSPGATSSIGMAMKLARLVTKKDGFLSFWDSFHGASIDAISLGGTAHFRNGIGGLLAGCEHLVPYNSYRPMFDEDTFLNILDYTLEKHGDIAAFFMETIRNTEVEIPSYKLMRGIRDICSKHNTLLVLDETAIAMGRTGKFFAFEHYDIEPDMVVIGKGLGGGVFPISALLTKDEFNIGQYTSLGHYTHEKSSVGCAAANAAIDFIDNNNILEKTSEMEKFLLEKLNTLKDRYEIIGDVRAIGLLFAVELVRDRSTKEKADSEADRILYSCLHSGLSFKVSGGILTLSPPLIIEKPELEKALEILEESIKIENTKLLEEITMNNNNLTDRPYILLTPGPLTTSSGVRSAMLKDWCTWDNEYNSLVQDMRKRVLDVAEAGDDYTMIPMQGSGTFSVEAVLTSTVGDNEKILILSNGAYGDRMKTICDVARVKNAIYKIEQTETYDLAHLEAILKEDTEITHVAVVHCETTSGILNPIKEIGEIVKKYNKTFIVDAMSSFGGIHFNVPEHKIDFLISSANKCIQGVPGFGFIVAKKSELLKCEGKARSHSLDIFDQWKVMESGNGKWRFTSPTHVVRAFYQALLELEAEGGVKAREARYKCNQDKLVKGMANLGFDAIISLEQQSPIITTFYAPNHPEYKFETFYSKLKEHGFVIYPGKLTKEESFRIGNIGEVYSTDIETLIDSIQKSMFWR